MQTKEGLLFAGPDSGDAARNPRRSSFNSSPSCRFLTHGTSWVFSADGTADFSGLWRLDLVDGTWRELTQQNDWRGTAPFAPSEKPRNSPTCCLVQRAAADTRRANRGSYDLLVSRSARAKVLYLPFAKRPGTICEPQELAHEAPPGSPIAAVRAGQAAEIAEILRGAGGDIDRLSPQQKRMVALRTIDLEHGATSCGWSCWTMLELWSGGASRTADDHGSPFVQNSLLELEQDFLLRPMEGPMEGPMVGPPDDGLSAPNPTVGGEPDIS